ncbi:MAG: Glu-tRNA(Gln) amidotransferase subunit GatE [bacterium]|nr:Glu-tRNA(Gln) amidotransferase subunit GatE [bacterium]
MSRKKKPILTASPPAPIDLNPRTDPPLDFPDRELDAMRPADYAELGFLCGLEVHQQLLTEGKLFCRCRAGQRSSRVDMEVLRHMRPTLSEMGEYDGTALMEFKTRKDVVYQIDRTTVCTYEIDDTPPFPIDSQSVRIALEISRLFGLNLVSELHVMRKQYLDGSIPTGFQRTALVGLGGVLPFQGSELGEREIRIRQLSIEEDSCREVSDLGHRVVFRPDRLGTPLVETVTEPDLLTPLDVARGGRLIADVARASGKVRRGSGAARQDVNVSIAGSRRVELKGVPHHRGLPLLVHNEAFRHLNLLRIRVELLRRGVEPVALAFDPAYSALESPLVLDAASIARTASYRPVRAAIDRGDAVWAVRMIGFAGLLAHRTQTGRTFAHEIAERVRVIACLTTTPFLINSDEHELVGGTWSELRKALRADGGDAIVLVWGPEADVDTAACEILIRGADALVGVPSETRQPHADGTTGFERILPGPERMYPDTDMPAIPVQDEWIEEIEVRLAEHPWEREDRYVRMGLSARAARVLGGARWAFLFDAMEPSTPACARRTAAALEKRLVHWWRESGTGELPAAERLAPLARAVDEGRVRAEAFERAFDRLLREPDATPAAIVSDFAASDHDAADFERAVSELERDAPAARHGDEALLHWAMGRVMPVFLGRLDPASVRARLHDALKCEEPV